MAWGNQKTTQTCFDRLKALGFSTVRIPVTWLGHIGEAPEYKIDEAWLDRVAEIVGYAEKAGLKAIVNIHHDGADSKYWLDIAGAAVNSELQSQILAEITAVWGQIAAKFADKGDFLIFEAFHVFCRRNGKIAEIADDKKREQNSFYHLDIKIAT